MTRTAVMDALGSAECTASYRRLARRDRIGRAAMLLANLSLAWSGMTVTLYMILERV